MDGANEGQGFHVGVLNKVVLNMLDVFFDPFDLFPAARVDWAADEHDMCGATLARLHYRMQLIACRYGIIVLW